MRIAIVGGGAAGLMTAATLCELRPEAEVFLIERNNGLGKKVLISGGGRCNVTTGIEDIKTVLTKYPRGNKFLIKAMNRFPPKAVRSWFESHGVPLKVEEDLRIFPISNDGADIVGVFERLFAAASVRILLDHHVQDIQRIDGQFRVSFKAHAWLDADIVVLTTGGQAYRHTGSTGDGYAFAESLGHSITSLAPSLSSYMTAESWPKELSGLSFQKITIGCTRNKALTFTGPMLFTHRGISGPAVFALSSLAAFETFDAQHPLPLLLNLFPEQSVDDIQSRLAHLITESPKKSILTILGFCMPKRLADVACRELKLDTDKRVAECSKKELRTIAEWLHAIPLQATARGAGDEFVTAGGVELSEVDPTTMESKKSPGVYFGGEILDIDGFTGGFNLQASWATGRLAGEAIARIA